MGGEEFIGVGGSVPGIAHGNGEMLVGESGKVTAPATEGAKEKFLTRKEMANDVEDYMGEHFGDLAPYFVGRRDVGFDASTVIDHLNITDEDINRVRPDLHIRRQAGRSVLLGPGKKEINVLGLDWTNRVEDMFTAAFIRDNTKAFDSGHDRRWFYKPLNRKLERWDFGMKEKDQPGKPWDITHFASSIRYEFQRIGEDIHVVSDQFAEEGIAAARGAERSMPTEDELTSYAMGRIKELSLNEKAKTFLISAVPYQRAWQRMGQSQNLLSTAEQHHLLHDDPLEDYLAFVEGESSRLSTAFTEPTEEQRNAVGGINYLRTQHFSEPILTREAPDAAGYARRLKILMLPVLGRRVASGNDDRLEGMLRPIIDQSKKLTDATEAMHSQIIGYVFLKHMGLVPPQRGGPAEQKRTILHLSKQANEVYILHKRGWLVPFLENGKAAYDTAVNGTPITDPATVAETLDTIDTLMKSAGPDVVQQAFTVAKQARFQMGFKREEAPYIEPAPEEPEWLKEETPPIDVYTEE